MIKEAEILPFWNHLTEQEKNHMQERAQLELYTVGEQLYGHCRECLGMILLRKGGIRVYISSPEGREITLFRLNEGDSCVLSAACALNIPHFDMQMAAEDETELLVVPAEDFSLLAKENIYVNCFQHEIVAKRFSQVMQVLQEMLFLSLEQRISKALLQYADAGGSLRIAITHQELAEKINSVREVVSRSLRSFESRGWVKLSRGIIELLEPEELRKLLP